MVIFSVLFALLLASDKASTIYIGLPYGIGVDGERLYIGASVAA